ncbi:hypothetical protein [Micromonospora fulviviridis]|uniref:hypothetical protein n=1 Tax=Micromonospora fulviviridis TaxID=47860 RepID=UPI0037BB0BCB
MPRLTKDARQRILDQNEGFSTRTYYDAKNSREERSYTISGGKLHIRATGRTSWADSHYDEEWIATEEEVHKFLYKHQREMNLDGIE